MADHSWFEGARGSLYVACNLHREFDLAGDARNIQGIAFVLLSELVKIPYLLASQLLIRLIVVGIITAIYKSKRRTAIVFLLF